MTEQRTCTWPLSSESERFVRYDRRERTQIASWSVVSRISARNDKSSTISFTIMHVHRATRKFSSAILSLIFLPTTTSASCSRPGERKFWSRLPLHFVVYLHQISGNADALTNRDDRYVSPSCIALSRSLRSFTWNSLRKESIFYRVSQMFSIFLSFFFYF